jgi:anti-anti-sigma factor
MQLCMETRPVGDVLIVQCSGRIIAGKEVFTLHSHVGDSFVKYGDIVLQLDQVEFIDSRGLGALVRLMQAGRAKGGDLKLSGAPATRKTLEMTSLLSQFETYDTIEGRLRPPIWARDIRAQKPETEGHASCACTTRQTSEHFCGKCCAAPDTTP